MRVHLKEDVLYIRLKESPYFESEEVRDGVVFDKEGKIIGLEILDVSENLPRGFESEMLDGSLS